MRATRAKGPFSVRLARSASQKSALAQRRAGTGSNASEVSHEPVPPSLPGRLRGDLRALRIDRRTPRRPRRSGRSPRRAWRASRSSRPRTARTRRRSAPPSRRPRPRRCRARWPPRARRPPTLARLSGLTLGAIVSVSDAQTSPYGPFGFYGTFGPDRFCGTVRTAVFRTDKTTGKRKRVGFRTHHTCRVPSTRHLVADRDLRGLLARMPTPESDRAARRRLVWLLLTRGDVGAEALRTDGLPALRSAQTPPARRISPRFACGAARPTAHRGEGVSGGRGAGGRPRGGPEPCGLASETEHNRGSRFAPEDDRERPATGHSLPSMILVAHDAASATRTTTPPAAPPAARARARSARRRPRGARRRARAAARRGSARSADGRAARRPRG